MRQGIRRGTILFGTSKHELRTKRVSTGPCNSMQECRQGSEDGVGAYLPWGGLKLRKSEKEGRNAERKRKRDIERRREREREKGILIHG